MSTNGIYGIIKNESYIYLAYNHEDNYMKGFGRVFLIGLKNNYKTLLLIKDKYQLHNFIQELFGIDEWRDDYFLKNDNVYTDDQIDIINKTKSIVCLDAQYNYTYNMDNNTFYISTRKINDKGDYDYDLYATSLNHIELDFADIDRIELDNMKLFFGIKDKIPSYRYLRQNYSTLNYNDYYKSVEGIDPEDEYIKQCLKGEKLLKCNAEIDSTQMSNIIEAYYKTDNVYIKEMLKMYLEDKDIDTIILFSNKCSEYVNIFEVIFNDKIISYLLFIDSDLSITFPIDNI